MEGNLKLMDYVIFRPAWGEDEPVLTQVVNMKVTDRPGEKHGRLEVEETSWDLIYQNRVLFSMKDGHWAYSEQLCVEESKLANVLMKETPLKDLPMYLGMGCDMIIESRLKGV